MSATDVALEPLTTTPTGDPTPRCQEIVKRTGKQCAKPATRGYEVCASHGAGPAPEAKPMGRPPIHGLYSRRERAKLAELTEEVYATEGALENSDRDLAALKATSWALKERVETFLPQMSVLEDALNAVEAVMGRYVPVRGREVGAGEMTVEDAREISRGVQNAARILSSMDSLMRTLADVQYKTINAHKVRAETQAKLAETQAVETFGRMCLALRQILMETIPDNEMYDALEARIRREILSPVNVELPDYDPRN